MECYFNEFLQQVVACEEFKQDLNNALKNDNSTKNLSVCVLDVSIEDKQSMYNYSTSKRAFFRVTVATPRLVPTIRRILEEGEFKFGDFPKRM